MSDRRAEAVTDSEDQSLHAVYSSEDKNLWFEAMYRQYAGDVLRVSYFYLGDRQKAEDVCQDVFVRLMTNCPDILPGREKAWLLKVALNRCRDLWRAAWMRRVVLGSPAFELVPADDDIEDRLEKTELMEAIHGLPAGFREVILLHYYQGYGINEIAVILGLPEGTISSRLSRGRKKLEEVLRASDAPPQPASRTRNGTRASKDAQ